MRFIAHQRRRGGAINMTPLIDLMFLLVIFILIAARFEPEAGIAVNLPSGQSGETPPEKTPTFTLALAADGEMRFERDPVTLEQLAQRLADARDAAPDAVLVIEGDRDVPYRFVAEALDQAKLAGQVKINLRLHAAPAAPE